MSIQDHPFAEIFPLLDEESLDRLAEDIKANGLNNPIILFEDKILDGRNRYRACVKAATDPAFVQFSGGDPVSFVISSNAIRRDLNRSQRAAAAVNADEIVERLRKEADERKKAGKADLRQKFAEGRPRDYLAKLFGVNRQYIQDALALKALPNVLQDIATRKEPQWKVLLAEFSYLRTVFNDVFVGLKSIADGKRERELFEYRQRVIEAEIEHLKKAEIVLADPPWRYDNAVTESRAVENQYDTQDLETIKQHKPITADDCVLFLWATAPKLKDALEVMEAWGFEYRTHAIWDKLTTGMGFWFRVRHELLLVGVKGEARTPKESLRVDSVFAEKRTDHSVKPQVVYEWIDSAFGDRVRLEMYARTKRLGWLSWGNEV